MPDSFDAIVVGSGATGGWAAMDLTERGLRVALLEAGPLLDGGEPLPDARDVGERQLVQSRCYAFDPSTAHLFVDDVENPYAAPEEAPFTWIRSRVVGGRLHTWGRTSVRMSDWDFKAASRDGVGEDWPISYADLAPHYDRVERFLGVCGGADGIAQIPDGQFTEPPPLSGGERLFKAAVERRWPTRSVTPTRIAKAPPEAMLDAARATGRLTLLADSVARQVLLDRGSGAVGGVAYVDRLGAAEREVAAPIVLLCASTLESTRLLLNSATPDHPAGLGNSSGVLGRYLFDHTYGVGVDGTASWGPRLGGAHSSYGCIVPAFRNVSEDADFLRSYQVELQVEAPGGGRLASLRGGSGPCWMRAFGEVLPNPDNQVSIDPDAPDAWGIPSLRIECRYGDNERRMAADQYRCLTEMAAVAGWEVAAAEPNLSSPGLSVHEMGTARMGGDPSGSVLDPNNECWDIRNLFVTDGSCFTSGGCQNPTLTMIAITARACEYAAARLARGEL